MALYKRGEIWWYTFTFARRRIFASTKSTDKTVAEEVQRQRRKELKEELDGTKVPQDSFARTLKEISEKYLAAYTLRHHTVTLTNHAVNNLIRVLGSCKALDIDEQSVRHYQNTRLLERAAPKTINRELGFLLRLMGTAGAALRVKLKQNKTLNLDVY